MGGQDNVILQINKQNLNDIIGKKCQKETIFFPKEIHMSMNTWKHSTIRVIKGKVTYRDTTEYDKD